MARQRKQVEKRLIYSSRVLDRMGGIGIGELNRVSRVHNAQLGVTGLLLCHQGRFFGVLEGHPDAVDDRFTRIMRDRRHGEIEILAQEAIRTRAFESWKLGITDPEIVPPILRRGIFAINDMAPPTSPERGATEDMRKVVRKFLASFNSLSSAPMKVAI